MQAISRRFELRYCERARWSPLPGRRRIDLRDPAQTVGFGVVRTRHECSADLGGIPAGRYAEAKRLFGLDVTRREILHQVLSVGWFDAASNLRDYFLVERSSRSVVAGEPRQVGKHHRDEVAVMRIGRR